MRRSGDGERDVHFSLSASAPAFFFFAARARLSRVALLGAFFFLFFAAAAEAAAAPTPRELGMIERCAAPQTSRPTPPVRNKRTCRGARNGSGVHEQHLRSLHGR